MLEEDVLLVVESVVELGELVVEVEVVKLVLLVVVGNVGS